MIRARAGTAAYGILRSRINKCWSGHIFGIPVICDPDMEENLIELRDISGDLMGRIENIGKDSSK